MRKKIWAVIAALCIVIGGVAGFKMTSSASSANISVTASSKSVKKEQLVDVSVKLSSDTLLEKVNATISYDDTILEFVSSNDQTAVGTSGIINISDTFETGAYEKTYALQFKAIEVGTSDLNISDAVAEAFDTADVIDISAQTLEINVEINHTESDEARLSDLLVAPESPEEDFSPDIYEYHVTVGSDTDDILLSATPMDENAVVTLEKPEQLSFGENRMTINVTSVSGKTATYTIYVNRLSSIQIEETETEDASVVEPESTSETEVNGDAISGTETDAADIHESETDIYTSDAENADELPQAES